MLGVIDAYSTGTGVPSWKMAAVYEGEASYSDAISPALRKWGVNKIKDQNEIETARSRNPRPAEVTEQAAGGAVGAGAGGGRGGRGAGAGRGGRGASDQAAPKDG